MRLLNQWQTSALLPGSEISPPPLAPLRPSNLPASLTPLLGVEDTAHRSEQIMREGARLLTLIGPGGIGKTRLGLELARRLQPEFSDGVVWVSLAPVRDSALVGLTIAQALGLNPTNPSQLSEQLQRYLADKTLLLVLDNFEQVLEARMTVRDLLQAAPHVRIIITSRAPLNIYGEHEFDVPSLRYPAPDDQDLARIAATPAVALFVHHAQAIRADFALTAASAAAVAQLCRELEGLPLALELAAAQIKLLAPAAMLGRLTNRLAFLRHGPADAPARHQTMRGALDWSYALLEPDQRTVFARLAVFAGGCSLPSAVAVCSLPDTEPLDVAECVRVLANQSLLYLDPHTADRLVMLETIREYALEHLEAGSTAALVRASHARRFLQVACELGRQLGADGQHKALLQLSDERDNLRIALQWAIDSGAGQLGLELVGCLWKFWRALGYQTEGRRFVQAVLERTATLHNPERAAALHGAGWLAADQNDLPAAQQAFEACLELAEQLGDAVETGLALQGLAEIAQINARYAEARSGCLRAMTIFRSVGNQEEIAWILDRLGRIALDLKEPGVAQQHFTESLRLFQTLNHSWGRAIAMFHLGQTYRVQGNLQLASDLFEQCVSQSRQMGELRSAVVAMALNHLALIALAQHHIAHAQSLAHECLELSHQAGYTVLEGDARIALARIATAAGDAPQALEYFRQCVAFIQQHPAPSQVAALLEALARFALGSGAERFATLLAGWNDALIDQHRFAGLPGLAAINQHLRDELVPLLPATVFAEIWEQGRTMDFTSGLRTIAATLLSLQNAASSP